jgi:hypothetical protein
VIAQYASTGYVVLAWRGTRLRLATAHPDGAARALAHSSPWLPSLPPIPTSSQDASSSAINVPLHLSPSSPFQELLCLDFIAFPPTPSSSYANILTVLILSSALENSSRTTSTSSRWMENHGRIQSQCAQKSCSSKSSILSTEPAIVSSPPWTMVVNRMTVSSWRFPAHHYPHPCSRNHTAPPLLPRSTVRATTPRALSHTQSNFSSPSPSSAKTTSASLLLLYT